MKRYLAIFLLAVVGTTTMAWAGTKTSVFVELDALEASRDAARSMAVRERVLIDESDQRLSDALADAQTARRASAPVRSRVGSTLGRWMKALGPASESSGTSIHSSRVKFLLRHAAPAAIQPQLEDFEVLVKVQGLEENYQNLLTSRLHHTVAFAQARAEADTSEAARAERLKGAKEDPNVAREIHEADEALYRSLSHLLKYETERDFHRLKGTLVPPVNRKTPSYGYGPRKTGHKVTVRHTGYTYFVPVDTEVRAVGPGLVVYAHRFEGFGNMVIVDHGGGYHTVYAHLNHIDVTLNSRVPKSGIVGRSGDSGSLDGAKVYFELRHNGRAIDPGPWFLRRE